MSHLKLYLFGSPRLEQNNQLLNPGLRKAMALLAYLAVMAQPHGREALATLLWPEEEPRTARDNLRRALSRLNVTLGEGQLAIEREAVGLAEGATLELDVAQFHQLLTSCRVHGHPAGEVCPVCLPLLSEAATLYSDDFLTGFTLPDAPGFDEWQFFQAEALRQELASALEQLARAHSAQGDPEAAIPYTRRRLALDPLHEPAHRQLMLLYAQAGQQAAALRQYQLCLQTLKTELGLAPAPETTTLYERIRSGNISREEFTPTPPPPSTPALLIAGQYMLQDLQADLLGQGSMGKVYRGQEVQTGAPVAIKLLKPEMVDAEMIERFTREGEILRRLNHPNIVKLMATAEEGGRYYLVMEYIGGGSLQGLLERQGPLPIEQVIDLALDLADALTRAHRLEIIHRDLKPSNVLLAEDGSPRLTDFGIARLASSAPLTQTGVVLGTIDYLSPEGCNGAKLDTRSDIWAFGVLLYELLTGQRPFRGENLITTMTAILTQPMPDLLRQRPETPEALARLIYRMLEKDPQQRLPSIRLVGTELEAIKHGRTAGGQSQRVEQSSPGQPLPTSLLAVISGPRHNLPAFSTPLVGREAELAELTRLLVTPEARLITILGPGGMGKTRLSVAAAAGQLENFAQGITFVPLAPVNPADFTGNLDPLVATMAKALKFALQAGSDPATQLLTYLQERETLLVLDNFEHYLASDHFPAIADFLSNLLSQGPGVKILVTSRERLNLQEEWLFSLQGLTFPGKTAAVSLETSEVGSGYSAVRLFEQRARQVKPDFDLAAEHPFVEQICQWVEGMPLGIELAAAWVRLMPCQAIVQELEKGLDVLTTQLRNVPERQRSLRTVFEHSWRLLSTAEREVMRKLSLFRGGFQREAAETVAGASLGVLSALLDKSLVRVTPSGRYELHELLRQYTAEKLRQRAEEEMETQTRHSRYYLGFLADQEQYLKGPKLKEARAALTTDLDNIRLAWHWTVEGGHYSEIGPAMESLWLFYELQGWLLEGEEVFARVVVGVRPLCDLSIITEGSPLTEANLILGRALGYQGFFQGRLGLLPSIALCQESLAMLRSAGRNARRETALALFFLSESIGWIEGQFRVGANLLQESVELYKEVGDSWGIGYALMSLGQFLHKLGEYVEAERVLQESITRLNKIGEQQYIVYAISTLGYIAEASGQYSQAEAIYQECLQRRTELGDRPGLSIALRNLGWVATKQGKQTQAQQYFEQSVALGREMGLFHTISNSIFGLGWATLALEEDEKAEKYFYEALKIAATDVHTQLYTLMGLAHLLARKGESERAMELLVLVLAHPRPEQHMKDLAAPLQAELAVALPPEVVADAQARGRARALEATAAEMLAELEESRGAGEELQRIRIITKEGEREGRGAG